MIIVNIKKYLGIYLFLWSEPVVKYSLQKRLMLCIKLYRTRKVVTLYEALIRSSFSGVM